MIKGETIKQKYTIPRPEVNYRALEGLNCSMIKLFDEEPIKFFEQFKLGRKRKDKKSTALIIGDLVDFYILDCNGNEEEFNNRFDEKFSLFPGIRSTAQAFDLADELFDITIEDSDETGEVKTTFDDRFSRAFKKVQEAGKYKSGNEDKALEDFNKKAYDYYQNKIDNIGRVTMDISLLEKGKKVAMNLLTDEYTCELFEHQDELEAFPKHVIEWIYTTSTGKVIDCKSELDLVLVNHNKKIIYPKDVKTTYDNELFETNYIKQYYYLQAAFYYLATVYWAKENGMQGYTIEPMEFIVADTSANNRRPIRYQCSSVDITKGLEGFILRGEYHRGVHELINDISWAEDNNAWNVSRKVIQNNGILKLNINYD